jgi:hypothetical protein
MHRNRKWATANQPGTPMPINAEERDRLIGVAQSYADGAAPGVRISIEPTAAGVLVRGARLDADGRERNETLNLSWEFVERAGAPERFLQTQVWAVEQGLTPAGTKSRPRP